jgi:hypothetical protein
MATKTQDRTFVEHALSPYNLAKVLEGVLREDEPERVVNPQMIYAYTRKGMIPVSLSETGKQVVSAEDANAFIEGYLARKAEREAKAAEKAVEEAPETN